MLQYSNTLTLCYMVINECYMNVWCLQCKLCLCDWNCSVTRVVTSDSCFTTWRVSTADSRGSSCWHDNMNWNKPQSALKLVFICLHKNFLISCLFLTKVWRKPDILKQQQQRKSVKFRSGSLVWLSKCFRHEQKDVHKEQTDSLMLKCFCSK